MRNHWRLAHMWGAWHHQGHPGRTGEEEYRQRRAGASSSVCCQRLFPARKGSGDSEASLDDTEPSLDDTEPSWVEAEESPQA